VEILIIFNLIKKNLILFSQRDQYNMSFEKSINYWEKFINPNGHLTISEVSWLTEECPTEFQDYWNLEYKETKTIENKINQLKKGQI
jgi:hypothetical protein